MIASWSPESVMLIMTYGLLCGLGLSFMYLAGIVAVSTYFHKRRTVATGLATCGSGVGMVLFAPLMDVLLHQYGWRWTLMVLGAVVLHGLMAASLVRSPAVVASRLSSSLSMRIHPGTRGDGQKIEKHGQLKLLRNALNLVVIKRSEYWFVLLGNFFASLGLIVPLLYISDRAKQVGVAETKAVFLLSIIGITNTVGRFLSALVVQVFHLNSVLVTASALLLCGLVAGLYPVSQSYPILATLSAMFGLGMAAYVTLSSVLLCDLLGPASLASAFGYVTMIRGVASLIGPPLAGAIIDSTNQFAPAFYLGGAMTAIGGVWHLLLYLIYFKLSPGHRDLQTLAEERVRSCEAMNNHRDLQTLAEERV
ncbi:hypothetical protein RRG08_059574 [Elysia crispata]|uniref:Major facilitator superfamily (MFS) profile domain-containing protein n=1 Tax=Elysia crispata TaxID=231223 RepID=A0AAE0YJ90_9GAST|nr:hypothetical protein RRG08_059574 [Elysia crispata]